MEETPKSTSRVCSLCNSNQQSQSPTSFATADVMCQLNYITAWHNKIYVPTRDQRRKYNLLVIKSMFNALRYSEWNTLGILTYFIVPTIYN